ncbi:hypothetical protein RISK_003897 [Rhodopirellula islandica]|uniref:Uncharacterized protein n=1 Tax=Rhodopirellula islandica TaxID=595434 RepID=A0A0J1BCR3_RHOIS|nr:hypothetical protein RISK_003897 [Rhodopirellula islandica]
MTGFLSPPVGLLLSVEPAWGSVGTGEIAHLDAKRSGS